MSITRFSSGLLVGAGLTYFLDPVRGRKRRARLRELASHAGHVERRLVGKAVRDAAQRVHGVAERARHPLAAEVSDGVLQGRARAALGRIVTHPGAVEVAVRDGRAVLRGAILAREADAAVGRVAAIPGVHEVIDRLERHASGDVPALQGEGRIARGSGEGWPPAAQIGAVGAGVLAAAWGLLVRRDVLGAALGVAGGALVARGAANRPLSRLFGPKARISVQKTITVHAPIEQVYGLCSAFERYPLFMEHVRAVEVNGKHSHWRVDGPAGRELAFDAELVRLEPDRAIGWETSPGQRIEHAGVMRFDPVPEGTRIHITMTYRPPGGVLGHAVAHLLGWDPKARLDDDLVRLKALLEEGHTRAHRARVTIEDLH